MSLANALGRRWQKLRSALELMDRAFDHSPLDDHARRIAALEARMAKVEETVSAGGHL